MCVVASFLNCGADARSVGGRGTSMFPTGWVRARTDAADRRESRARRRENFYEGFGEATRGLRRGRRARGPAQRPARGADRYPRLGTRGTAESAIARRADARTLSTATPTPASMMNRSERRLMVARLERLSVCHIATARPPSDAGGAVVGASHDNWIPIGADVEQLGSRDPRRHRHFALAEPSPAHSRGRSIASRRGPFGPRPSAHTARRPSNRIA